MSSRYLCACSYGLPLRPPCRHQRKYPGLCGCCEERLVVLEQPENCYRQSQYQARSLLVLIQSSNIVHSACWLILPISVVVFNVTELAVLVLVFLVGLFVNVSGVLLDVVCI